MIFDSKIESEKDLIIWEERTKGKVPVINLYDTNILVPFYFVKSHSSQYVNNLINQRDISLLINCGTPRIIKKELIEELEIGILNCHPGLLPNYRGCSCVEWALYNGDEVGNTCHLMTSKVDEGPIIYISKIDINSLNNYQSIRTKVYQDSITSIIEAISIIKRGEYNKLDYPQNGKYYKPISSDKMQIIYNQFGSL